jgi:hypothetical protein
VRTGAPDGAIEGKHPTDAFMLELTMMFRVQDPERHLREVDTPTVIGQWLEAEELVLQRRADIPTDSIVTDVPVRVSALDDEVPWIVRLRESRRKFCTRPFVELARCPLPNTFVRSFEVVLLAKLIKAALLAREARLGRRRCLRLESSVHSLVSTVLVRSAGKDAFRHDAETEPPHGELGETGDGER